MIDTKNVFALTELCQLEYSKAMGLYKAKDKEQEYLDQLQKAFATIQTALEIAPLDSNALYKAAKITFVLFKLKLGDRSEKGKADAAAYKQHTSHYISRYLLSLHYSTVYLSCRHSNLSLICLESYINFSLLSSLFSSFLMVVRVAQVDPILGDKVAKKNLKDASGLWTFYQVAVNCGPLLSNVYQLCTGISFSIL